MAGFKRLLLALCPLLLGELLVRSTGLEYRLIRPLLYYQTGNLDVHSPSADVQLGYGLKPNSIARFKGKVFTINSLGFRGPERSAKKSPGMIRILCLGGSNTFGAAVNDGETYPAQLERVLNGSGSNHYEVWNAGVLAYVLSQDVAAAQNAVDLLDPDILLFMRTNRGRRAFLPGQDVAPYFSADPRLFLENLPFVPFAGTRWGMSVLSHWALYRAAVIAYNRVASRALKFNYDVEKRINIPALDAFAKASQGRRTIIMVSNPSSYAANDPPGEYPACAEFGCGPDLPWIDLGHMVPKGAGPEYRLIHPPASVYRWYAETIAAALKPYLKRAR